MYMYLIHSDSESEIAQSCPTLCNPINCSLPGSSLHGTFQARVLEWVAISFSIDRYKCIHIHMCLCILLVEQLVD